MGHRGTAGFINSTHIKLTHAQQQIAAAWGQQCHLCPRTHSEMTPLYVHSTRGAGEMRFRLLEQGQSENCKSVANGFIFKKWNCEIRCHYRLQGTWREQVKEQVERAHDGTGGESTWWNRWRNDTMEQVERACDGILGETTRWNRRREHMMEQVEKPHSRASGESTWWNRWREHTVEHVQRACDGTGAELTQWNKWREHVMQ